MRGRHDESSGGIKERRGGINFVDIALGETGEKQGFGFMWDFFQRAINESLARDFGGGEYSGIAARATCALFGRQ